MTGGAGMKSFEVSISDVLDERYQYIGHVVDILYFKWTSKTLEQN